MFGCVLRKNMIIKFSSDITSWCMTDLKAESSLNAGSLFCSTADGRIFAIQLGSYWCQIADSSLSEKPLQVEIADKNVLLHLSNVLAMASVKSQIAVLFNNTGCVSLALYAVSEDMLTLSEPRIHKVYTCKWSELSNVVPASLITIVVPGSVHEKSVNQCDCSSNVLHVSDKLFNVLFGVDLNLSRCPVVLLGDDSGLVLWLPMKAVVGSPSSVQVLCSLRDNLVHILTFCSVSNGGVSALSSYLILIGHHGRILVISSDSDGTTPYYRHYDILGPVRCCTSFDNSYVLYSTGNELYAADVGQSIKSNQSGSIKSTALGLSGVVAFSSVCLSHDNRTARSCLVLAAMSDGRVVELEIDNNAVDGHARRRFDIYTVQNSMANFLSTIGQTGECLRRVKLDSEAKDYILKQLAIAGSLLHSHCTSAVHCNIAASVDNSSSPCCRQITASLLNTANFSLGCKWTFLMSVSPSTKCCSCEDHAADNNHCRSCPTESDSLYALRDVSGLSLGMTESISLVINSSVEVPLIVETALIYSPVNQVDSATKQISIPLATQVFDILDFVRLALPPMKHLRCSSRRVSFESECHRLQQLCRHQFRDDSDAMPVDEMDSRNRNTASVKEHCMSVYASKLSNVPDVKTNRLMSTLLESLSSEVGTTVEFVCPEGQTFTVEVLPSADDGYQLILHSSDLRILIAVRLSLINRLRTRAHCSVVEKPTFAATYRRLRSQLDDVHDSVSFGAAKRTAARRLVALYETLRCLSV